MPETTDRTAARLSASLERLAELTPQRIVAELDRFIVGQQAAKKAVAIALRNRWRRQRAPEPLRREIAPANLILIGPTGVGKTEIARRLARLAGAPFLKVEASKFTEVGYVGRDVESIVRDLVEEGIALVRAERQREVAKQADARVEERLLDLLLPPPGDASAPAEPPRVFVAGPDGGVTPQRADDDPQQRWQRSREKLRQRLHDGQFEDREVEVTVTEAGPSPFGIAAVPGAPGAGGAPGGEQFLDWLKDLMPKRTAKRRMPVRDARGVLREQEIEGMLRTEDLVPEAIARVEQLGIVFLDEIDKVAVRSGTTAGPDVSREGVQRDLLPIVEGSTVTTKHGPVKTDHVLFIAAGAFHVSKPGDLIPELQGRFPIRVELQGLTEDDFVRIMTEPEHALTRQYAALCAAEGADLRFTDDGIRALAKVAFEANARMENIGARRLHTVMTALLDDVLFSLPERGPEPVVVDAPMVQAALGAIVEDPDLRRYIL